MAPESQVDIRTIRNSIGIRERTIVEWYNYAKRIWDYILKTNDNKVIGRLGIVVVSDDRNLFEKKEILKGQPGVQSGCLG